MGLSLHESKAQLRAAEEGRAWQFRSPMPTARTGVAAVAFNDRIYTMGGLDANGKVLNIVEIYDPASDTWQHGAGLRDARYNSAAVVIDDRILLMGGRDSTGSAIKKVEMFDPGDNDWNSFDNLNDEREGLAAVVLDGEVHVMGGSDGNANILDSVEILDIAEEKWEYYPEWQLDVPRALFAAASTDDLAYVIGGFSSFGPMGLVQQYDKGDGTTDLASLFPGRGGLSAAMLEDDVYVIGGRLSSNQVVKTVNQFMPDENRWVEVQSLNQARERFAAVAFDDDIFVFGGNDTNGAVLDAVEAFVESVVPVTENDILVTAEDAEMSINVLVNDADPAGGQLAISSFSQPANGSVRQLDTATLTYTPDPDFFGQDEFTYTAINQGGGTAPALVSVTVGAVNDPPLFASEPVIGTTVNATYTYNLAGVDVDGDQLTFSEVVVPDWLILTPSQSNTASLTGIPDTGQVGTHEVVIQLTDGQEAVEQIFNITVVEGPPGEAELSLPENGAVDLATVVTLSWQVAGASGFDLEVALDSTFNSLYFEAPALTTTSFELTALEANTQYFWRVRGINAAGVSNWSNPYRFTTALDTGAEDESPNKYFTLHPGYPNPFREAIRIDFELSAETSAPVELSVYDMRGRQMVVLEAGTFGPGNHSVLWRGDDASGMPLASGTYLVRLQRGPAHTTQLVVLLR